MLPVEEDLRGKTGVDASVRQHQWRVGNAFAGGWRGLGGSPAPSGCVQPSISAKADQTGNHLRARRRADRPSVGRQEHSTKSNGCVHAGIQGLRTMPPLLTNNQQFSATRSRGSFLDYFKVK